MDSFKVAAAFSENCITHHINVTSFLNAMIESLRIFDAFYNPFFFHFVMKDVNGNNAVRYVA